ncbi:MAG: rhomboid family intramembrane serine protease [Colwellia sp.]
MDYNIENKTSIVTDTEFNEQRLINLKPIAYFSLIFNIILVYVVAASFGVYMAMIEGGDLEHIPYLIGATLLGLAIALTIRYFTLNKIAASIQFTVDEILIPRWFNSQKHHKISYSSLKSIDIRGKGKNQILVIGTLNKIHVFALRKIVESKLEIESLIKLSILKANDGENIWSSLNTSQINSKELMKYNSFMPIALCTIMILIFAASRLWGTGSGFLDLLLLGGNSPLLVSQGQWDRLFTSNFLHIGLLHLYFNMMAFFVFGNVLEKLMGRKNLLLVFLFACLGGAIASCYADRSLVSVGASGGIFGLMGSLLFINLKMGFRLPAGFNLGKQSWLIMLCLNGGLPFLIPQIDWVAHLGGFVVGVVITWILLRKHMSHSVTTKEQLEKWRITSPIASLSVVVISGLFLLAFINRIVNIENHQQDVNHLITDMQSHSNLSPSLVNNIAWDIVIDSNRSPVSLNFANKLMLPVINDINSSNTTIDPEPSSEYLDTYASVQFLQADYSGALKSEYKAMTLSNNSFYASQVSRFLSAINADQGPWINGEGKADDFLLRESSGNTSLVRRSVSDYPVSITVHARLDGVRKGYFVCVFNSANQLLLPENETIFNTNRTSLDLNIAAIDTQRIDKSMLDTCSSVSVDGMDSIETENFFSSLL